MRRLEQRPTIPRDFELKEKSFIPPPERARAREVLDTRPTCEKVMDLFCETAGLEPGAREFRSLDFEIEDAVQITPESEIFLLLWHSGDVQHTNARAMLFCEAINVKFKFNIRDIEMLKALTIQQLADLIDSPSLSQGSADDSTLIARILELSAGSGSDKSKASN